MIWLLWKLISAPFRIAFLVLRIVRAVVAKVGLSRILAFGAGIGVGVNLPPETVDQARARVQSLGASSGAASAPDLATAVRTELAQSPRTWHLPQPTVVAAGNRITLTGTVPHQSARGDLGRVAGAVVGVAAIDNRLTVAPTPDRDD